MAMQFMPPDFHHHHHHHHHVPPHPHTHAPPTPPNTKGTEPGSPQAPPMPPSNLCHVWHPTTGQLIPLFNDVKDDVKKDKQRERKVIPILDPKTRTPVFVEPRKDVKPIKKEVNEDHSVKHNEKTEPAVETSLDITQTGLKLEEALRSLKGNDSSGLNLNLYSLSLDEIAPPKKESPRKPAPAPAHTPAPAPVETSNFDEEEFPPEEDLPPPPTVSHAVQQTEDLDEAEENLSQGTKTPEPVKSPPLAPKDKAQPWRPKTEHVVQPIQNTKVDWADVEVEEEETPAVTTSSTSGSTWAQAARSSGGQASRRVLEQQQKATSLIREKEERARKEREAREKEEEEERQRRDQSDRFGKREPNQTGRVWGRGTNENQREGGRAFGFGRDRGDREGWNKNQGQFPSAPLRGSQSNSQAFSNSRNGPSTQNAQPFRSTQQHNSPNNNLRPNRPTPAPEAKPKQQPAQKIVVKEEDGWDVVISKKTIIENRKKGVEITVVKEKSDTSPPVPSGEFENRAKRTEDKAQKLKLSEEQLKPLRNKIRNLKKKLTDIDELKGKPDLNEDQLKKIKQESEIKKELEKAQADLNEYL